MYVISATQSWLIAVGEIRSHSAADRRRTMPDPPDTRLGLSPTQQELFKALAEKREDLAPCYHAGIAIINDPVLPDRLPLAAHAFRELMEKLPSDGTAVDQGAALADDVRALRLVWERATRQARRRRV